MLDEKPHDVEGRAEEGRGKGVSPREGGWRRLGRVGSWAGRSCTVAPRERGSWRTGAPPRGEWQRLRSLRESSLSAPPARESGRTHRRYSFCLLPRSPPQTRLLSPGRGNISKLEQLQFVKIF